METAAKILIAGGVLNLALSLVMGFVLSRKRLRQPELQHPWLLRAHTLAMFGGFMLLGLVFAVELSPLSSGWEITAAWLLVGATAFQDASQIANWLQGVGDQFVERRAGYTFAVINAVLGLLGLAILVVGVFRGL